MRTRLLAAALVAAFAGARAQAPTKISQMPAASPLGGTELIPVVQSALNAVTTPSALLTYIQGHINVSGAAIYGTPTAGHCVAWYSASQVEDAGAACGSGTGGITALTGDGAASGSGSVALTVTKAGGVAFAPSATTDTTNAANIVSGVLPAGRISGSYTGLTGIGALAVGSIPASLITGLGSAASVNTGASGAVLGLLNGANTYSGADIFTGSIGGAALANYFASPPAIGGTTPAAGAFATLSTSGNLTTNITGLAQCLQVNPAGVVGGSGGACGGVANLTLTAPAAATTLTIASGSTFTTSGAYAGALAFTASTTATFPAGTVTLAGLTTSQNFSGVDKFAYLGLNGASGQFTANSQTVMSGTAPTITSGLGTSPAVTDNSGTAAFLLTAGSAGTPAVATVLGLPAASHGWRCTADDLTTTSEVAHQTGAPSTTAVTLTWYALTTGVASAPSLSDQIAVSCMGF